MLIHSFLDGALFALALQLPSVATANAVSRRDWELSDAPSPSLFLRRASGRISVLGNHVYIDGGEISQLGEDGNITQPRSSNAVNSTLSIDMSASWSSSSVAIQQIPKTPKPMDEQAIWTNEATNSFYIWGGHSPFGAKLDDPALWKFEADGKGGGAWSKEVPANPTLFSELRRNEDGAFVTAKDTAFWFGGSSSGWTSPNPYTQPVPGILSYNFTTKTWANETTNAFSKFGTMIGGRAVYVPTFGPNGLITLLGGNTWNLMPDQKSPIGWMDFSNLTFFDPITRDWFWQNTTGNAPTPRSSPCTVGVQGKNGTYEIFVFGGANSNTGSTYDDVFVLSLPGFVWTQFAYEAKSPRTGHSCAVVGRRQMLSVGGMSSSGWASPDPWPQGLGLFDMTEWAWKTDYDADAKEYESSQTIKDWYQDVGTDSVQWSSEKVKALFNKATEATTPTSSPSPGQTTTTNKSEAKPNNTPLIVGVAVGAGVGLVLGAAIFWFLRRRRQQQKKQHEASIVAPAYSNYDGSTAASYYHPVPPSEAGDNQVHEMWSGAPDKKQEMWAPIPTEMTGSNVGHHTVTELEDQQGRPRNEIRHELK
ncbi:Kelch repeat-containing protein-like protein 1 [Colletotrichum chlorophyti]|uniref:Kelch repeat-containing protein-like protein 1 n=1 Tax=Colletotrichum chlorophyti TaxID=708187 RepID=A0A1Q8RUT2_9PEZI|nr:Kelch repeat-containing protein-like protein 1 [Colletotrichum chlorophyti]